LKKILLILLCLPIITVAQTYKLPEFKSVYFPKSNAQIQAEAYLYRLEYENNKKQFDRFSDLAIKAYKDNNYKKCIFYYKQTKKLGWEQAYLYYVVGLSYLNLNKKFFAKKFLRKSAKLGYTDAFEKLGEI
tara:strand:+ start:223 stop:615 length:393 start_codon:yes stop_codon:yes gene_type:complete